MRKLKLYLESSVWNFFFADDAPEKKDITKILFNSVGKNVYEIFISEVVLREIGNASEPKRSSLFELVNKFAPTELEITEEAEELAQIYLNRKIVPEEKRDDALHVAVATIFEVDALITWNYRHLDNLRKSELFHSVNLEKGYTKQLNIVTPMEVIRDED